MEQERKLTIKDFVDAFFRRFPLWIFFSALVLAAVIAANYFIKDRLVVTAVVNFSYDGIESGRDPVGNRFDEQEIKAESQIRAAAQAVAWALSDEDVQKMQNALEIHGVVPTDIFESIIEYESIYGKDAIEKETNIRESAYFPSQYTITLHYAQAGISESQGTLFLGELLSAYERYFYDQFGYNPSLEQSISSLDYEEYDYINAVDVLTNRLASLRSYLASLSAQDNTRFVSTQTGYSFPDLLDAVDTIQTEDIGWITSYIVTNNMTKEHDDLVNYYRYKIKDAQREIAQRESRLYTLIDQIAGYVKTNAIFLGVVDNSSTQEDGSPANYEFSQKSAMYDSMIREKVSCETAISETQEQIALYELRIERLLSGPATGDPEVVEEGLSRIADKVAKFLADTRQTSDEFFKTVWLERAFQVLREPQGFTLSVISLLRDSLPVAIMAEAAVFGLFLLRLPKAVRAKKARQSVSDSEETPPEQELSMEGSAT